MKSDHYIIHHMLHHTVRYMYQLCTYMYIYRCTADAHRVRVSMVVGLKVLTEQSSCQLRCRAPGSWKGLVVDVAWMWMFVGVLTLIGDLHMRFLHWWGGLVRFDVCYANDLLSNLPPEVMLCYCSLLLHLPPVVMLHYWSLRHEFEKLVAISNLFTIGCDFLRMKVVFGIEKRPLEPEQHVTPLHVIMILTSQNRQVTTSHLGQNF